jgi:NTP pyrophosphatase (non-canonical NTP hydrolase)
MNEIIREILIITQEEAAEVIQEISKVQRFGFDTTHKSGQTNQEALEQEIGDFLAMVDLLL